MGRPTYRPTTVTFAAFVAAIGGFWTLIDSGLLFVIGASFESPLVIAFGGAMIVFGLLRILVAGALFQMRTWSRPVGMLLFALAGVVNVWTLVTAGGGGSIVALVANGGAFVGLALSGDAFTPDIESADISDEPATKIGTGSR
ncbi:hypothetical protein [Haloarchaeobius iranensis]|uniref:Uncharacterized protein n=1 Tax=Haloarchaeobius iranensis TaxID=996166 RepID=A0A1G9V285_9EURY|nr:hypothetical protein [Haloarchaeobius iranensis]SDM66213.1 hypothetical protein SAMN05192554_105146 [Haloarchaeobius iranensis]